MLNENPYSGRGFLLSYRIEGMPTYKYKCSNDDEHTQTEVRSITAPEPEDLICAEEGCGGTMKKVFGAPNIEFKGGGWSTKETWR